MSVLAWFTIVCAAVPALLYLWNSFLFRTPPAIDNAVSLPPISVLIPARDEEAGIAACVRSVLASRQIELEVLVLDDASADRTAEIVHALAAEDSRVRLIHAPPLPYGWCGKQHACLVLSKHACFDTLTFLDADVRLAPDALARITLFQKRSGAELVSGFPHQETGTVFEKLLIPLINWLLLSFLPLWGMRHTRWSAFGAGCGQWFMATRSAYEMVGGHAAVKASRHDGLTLPRAYRRAGFYTDVCDATNIATCRMYYSARGVWFGLTKNAREGMAGSRQIWFWTVVLFCGQVLPFVLLACEEMMWLALPLVLAPRALSAWRFRQSWFVMIVHPLAITLLLAVQWYARFSKAVAWKGRPLAPEENPSNSCGN